MSLQDKGFKDARIEEASVSGRGTFYRVVATERYYSSATEAARDIERWKAQGRIPSGWVLVKNGAE